jgi:hypothetical protein
MSVRATVVVPTHDHGPTLLRSIPTALGQTVQDIEVFVIGDGAPDVTREIMADLVHRDRRVRFFDNPKGPGNGELHRHAALEEAGGRFVAYLGDDDLWLPEHLEVLDGLLQDADFAHSYPIRIGPDGSIADWNVDLSLPWFRETVLSGTNFVPLSCAAHTLELYRRLPHGWRTRPEGTWSDLYMWQQILTADGVRAASGTRPTVVHLPSSLRSGWSQERRLEELDRWVDRIGRPGVREDIVARSLDLAARGQAHAWQALQEHRLATVDLRGQLDRLREHLKAREDELTGRLDGLAADREEERRSLGGRLDAAEAGLEARIRELAAIRATRTWRLRERLLGAPLLGPVVRWAARARSRRAAR